jgi:hypothetical protein
VSRDGQRFLVLEPLENEDQRPTPLTLVTTPLAGLQVAK